MLPRPSRFRIRALTLTVVVAIGLVTACSSASPDPSSSPQSGGNTVDDTAAAGIDDPDALARDLADRGPHPVGFTRDRLDDGRDVVVWYPSTDDAVADKPTETIDLVGFLSAELQAKVPDADRVTYDVDAYEDAEPLAGAHPVVVFSHGFAGFAEQSVDITTHLASRGWIVAAPNHVERSLDGLLGDAADEVTGDADDPEVLAATLDWLTARNDEPDGLFTGNVDSNRVAVAGPSRGASAAYLAAADDDRFGAFIAYSIDVSDSSDDPPVPEVPGMVMSGTADGINDPAAGRAAFATMTSPKYLVEIEGAGHLVFSDICEIGKDEGGIVELAKQLELPIPDELLALGTDGCTDEFPPVTYALGAIRAATVAFLDDALDVGGADAAADADAVLASGPLSSLGTPVEVTAD